MGLFSDLFSTDAADAASKAKIAGIQQGQTQGNADLTTGLNSANSYYGQAQQPFTNLISSTGAGASAYGDATGANGQGGIDRATAAFKSMPGYQGGLDTGVNLLERRAAARGDLGGGNTSADTLKFASDYDNQHYGDYTSKLAPYLAANQSAVAGNASVLGSQAGANLGVGQARASLDNGAATGIGKANADAQMARYGASKNFWGALMGGAQLAMGMPPTSWSSLSPTGSSESYGGGNKWSGDAYGGSKSNPLPGLSPSDYE